jgi:hypothetical protein
MYSAIHASLAKREMKGVTRMRIIEHHGEREVRVLRMDHPTIEQCRRYVYQEVVAKENGRNIILEYPASGWTFWATEDQRQPPM